MSAAPEEHALESTAADRSSVCIEMDSKGLAKVRVKVYEGTEPPEMDATRELAVRTFNSTKQAVGG